MVTLVASGASASFAMMSSDSSMSLDSSMMKKDAMMKDEKMKMADDTKMMAKKYTRMTTSALAKSM